MMGMIMGMVVWVQLNSSKELPKHLRSLLDDHPHKKSSNKVVGFYQVPESGHGLDSV